MQTELSIEKVKDLYYGRRLSVSEISRKLLVSSSRIYSLMSKQGLPRRNNSLASFAAHRHKPQFVLNNRLDEDGTRLKTAGIMLYWAEGTLLGNTVDFANSSPEMVAVFLRFLRRICGVQESRLRVYLYGYDCQNVVELKRFWQKVTGVPLEQFTKPFIRKGNPNVTRRKLPHGMVHIRYNDKKLLCVIKSWIEDFYVGQVPKWLKGTDCRKCSARQ